MARLTRLEIPLFPHLVVQAVRAGERLVHDEHDEKELLNALKEAVRDRSVAVHAYAVMFDRLLLLASPVQPGALSAFMQAIGRRYVFGYNRRHGRQGSLWAGRYRCAVIDPAQYLLEAMMFIEMPAWHLQALPVAAMEPGSGRCGSLGHHLGRFSDPLVTDHSIFWALGNTPFDREAAWRRKLEQGQDVSMAQRLAAAVRGGWALGGDSFMGALTARVDRPLAPRPRGRPRKDQTIRP